jgi:hypothetical protein
VTRWTPRCWGRSDIMNGYSPRVESPQWLDGLLGAGARSDIMQWLLTPRRISSVTRWTPLCWGRKWTFRCSQALGPTTSPAPATVQFIRQPSFTHHSPFVIHSSLLSFNRHSFGLSIQSTSVHLSEQIIVFHLFFPSVQSFNIHIFFCYSLSIFSYPFKHLSNFVVVQFIKNSSIYSIFLLPFLLSVFIFLHSFIFITIFTFLNSYYHIFCIIKLKNHPPPPPQSSRILSCMYTAKIHLYFFGSERIFIWTSTC